jgi:hypothetical protein
VLAIRSSTMPKVIEKESCLTAQRNPQVESKRRTLISSMLAAAGQRSPDLHVLGMSATPIINNLQEGKGLIEMVRGESMPDIRTKLTIPNCVALHRQLVRIGLRYKPDYGHACEEIPIEVDASAYLDELKEHAAEMQAASKPLNPMAIESILTRARIPTIVEQAKKAGRALVYTHYVEEGKIVQMLVDALRKIGKVGVFTGDDHSGQEQFIRREVDFLVCSNVISTGVDGLQKVCDTMITNALPWTYAEFEQLKHRLYRQGQTSSKVRVIMPLTHLTDGARYWSWDRSNKVSRLNQKRDIAATVVDGRVPDKMLRTPEQAARDLMGWLKRLNETGPLTVVREKLMPLFSVSELPSEAAQRRAFSEFSRLNAKWNRELGSTRHERLQGDAAEFRRYHEEYGRCRAKWPVDPCNELVRWFLDRDFRRLKIGDFGCGEAFLARALGGQHEVVSYDHVAIDPDVTVCDLAKVPAKSATFDFAVFCLSLMGSNYVDYLREAHRALRLGGGLHVIEPPNGIDVEELRDNLRLVGFKLLEGDEPCSKFVWIRAEKARRSN